MTTKCNTVQNSINDYLDGELSPKKLAGFNAHIRNCEKCGAEVKFAGLLRDVCKGLGNEALEPPAGFRDSVMASIRNEAYGGTTGRDETWRDLAGQPVIPDGGANDGADDRLPDNITRKRFGDMRMGLQRQLRVAAMLVLTLTVGFAASVFIQNYSDRISDQNILSDQGVTMPMAMATAASANIIAAENETELNNDYRNEDDDGRAAQINGGAFGALAKGADDGAASGAAGINAGEAAEDADSSAMLFAIENDFDDKDISYETDEDDVMSVVTPAVETAAHAEAGDPSTDGDGGGDSGAGDRAAPEASAAMTQSGAEQPGAARGRSPEQSVQVAEAQAREGAEHAGGVPDDAAGTPAGLAAPDGHAPETGAFAAPQPLTDDFERDGDETDLDRAAKAARAGGADDDGYMPEGGGMETAGAMAGYGAGFTVSEPIAMPDMPLSVLDDGEEYQTDNTSENTVYEYVFVDSPDNHERNSRLIRRISASYTDIPVRMYADAGGAYWQVTLPGEKYAQILDSLNANFDLALNIVTNGSVHENDKSSAISIRIIQWYIN